MTGGLLLLIGRQTAEEQEGTAGAEYSKETVEGVAADRSAPLRPGLLGPQRVAHSAVLRLMADSHHAAISSAVAKMTALASPV